jgi:SAM-dependent methyltransferase
LERQTLSYKEYWGYYWRIAHLHQIPGIFQKIEQIVDLIEKACELKPRAEVLDLGCAGGDQLKVFAKKGYKVTGIDFVPSLIDYARDSFAKESLPGEFIIDDMQNIGYENRFDLIIMLSGVFCYVDDTANKEFLAKIHRALKPGGKVFIDYMPIERYIVSGRKKDWREIEGGYSLSEEWVDVPTSTYRSRHTHIFLDGRIIESAEDGCASEILRCYSAREIEALAVAAGFTIAAHLTRNHIGNPAYSPHPEEPRGMIVLKKTIRGGE